MIVTVTLNPAIDRTLVVPKFKAGTVNRAVSTRIDSGGKGINVSKALKELGTESLACGLIAGQNGRYIKEQLSALGINYDFVEVPGQTRINIKIIDENGMHTDINEPGFDVTESVFARLTDRVSNYAKHGNIIIISGSVPPNLPLGSYSELCCRACKKDVRLVLDADGEHLRAGLSAKPYFIKPNLAELTAALGYKVETFEEIKQGAYTLIGEGAQNVAISLGAEGAMFINEKQTLFVRAPKVPVLGPVGAGDVMVAGIAHSMENSNNLETLARFAVAASAASVTIEGTRMASRRTVLKLFEEITVERI